MASAHTAHGWWQEEAGEVARRPALHGSFDADVVIVGGGYTGLWTAWFLAETEPDTRVAVLEAERCGTGPSGRNGGFVNAMWSSLPTLRRRFGDAAALAVARASRRPPRPRTTTRSRRLRRPVPRSACPRRAVRSREHRRVSAAAHRSLSAALSTRGPRPCSPRAWRGAFAHASRSAGSRSSRDRALSGCESLERVSRWRRKMGAFAHDPRCSRQDPRWPAGAACAAGSP